MSEPKSNTKIRASAPQSTAGFNGLEEYEIFEKVCAERLQFELAVLENLIQNNSQYRSQTEEKRVDMVTLLNLCKDFCEELKDYERFWETGEWKKILLWE